MRLLVTSARLSVRLLVILDRVEPPHGPPLIYTYRGSGQVLLVNLLVFWDWIACKLITVLVIFLHVVIRTCTWFFFETPSFEESRDSNSSPRREEVGRRTLGDYGGFLLPFFYRDRFQLLTGHFPVFVDEASKTTTNKPPDTLGILESTSPRKALHDWWGNFSRGRFLKKNSGHTN